jgi:cytoplasmic iron level regulating protein YaaA (DUF328/UPF0246 family)
VVVNLASQEYFKAVDARVLKARVIDCVFEDYKGGKYKIISFHAKRARGLMVRYAAVTTGWCCPSSSKPLTLDGYAGLTQRPRRRCAWCSGGKTLLDGIEIRVYP